MTQLLNPFSGHQFVDSNGAPYASAKLFIYDETTTTKRTTTKDKAGLSNHTNPIILNARGFPADVAGAAQAIWQPEGINVKLVLAPATDTDPPTSPIDSWDNIPGINDESTLDEWQDGAAPTFISATSFTVPGDLTSTYHVGRKTKTTNTGGTIYSTIITSVYTSLTTVTVINDSGSLDSGLSALSYGLLSADNPSLSVEGVTPILGPDIASATVLPYPAYGTYSDVTGTTTITSFATSGIVGTVIKRHFDGILTLTHHATNLILPEGINITTVAGDELEFVEYATGDWRCTGFVRTRRDNPVILDTPELIYSGAVSVGPVTVDNSTLSGASARAAILRCTATCIETTATPGSASLYLRKTGSGLASDAVTIACQAIATGDGVNPGRGSDSNTTVVNLDTSYDFDYEAIVGAGTDSAAMTIYLLGYYIV